MAKNFHSEAKLIDNVKVNRQAQEKVRDVMENDRVLKHQIQQNQRFDHRQNALKCERVGIARDNMQMAGARKSAIFAEKQNDNFLTAKEVKYN